MAIGMLKIRKGLKHKSDPYLNTFREKMKFLLFLNLVFGKKLFAPERLPAIRE
jgi:hypothetical protein